MTDAIETHGCDAEELTAISAPDDARDELADEHVRAVFEVTDRSGRFPVTGGRGANGHVYEPGASTSLCGQVDDAEDQRSRACEASHDHSLVYDQRICFSCSRSVRKRVREDGLTTGSDELDAAIRTRPGDAIAVETPTDEYRMTVDEVGRFEHGTVRMTGRVERDAPADVEHWSDHIRVTVDPRGDVTVTPPHDLTVDYQEVETTGTLVGDLVRPAVTDGGSRVDDGDRDADTDTATDRAELVLDALAEVASPFVTIDDVVEHGASDATDALAALETLEDDGTLSSYTTSTGSRIWYDPETEARPPRTGADTETGEVEDLAVTAAGRPADTKWKKRTVATCPCIDLGIAEIITAPDGDGVLAIQPSDADRVNLNCHLETEHQGVELEAGAIHELTPEQAEALAAALVEDAARARAAGEEATDE